MKSILNQLLSHRFLVVITMVLAAIFSLADRNYGYFFGIGVVFLLLRQNKFNWSEFGLNTKLTWKTAFQAFLYTIGMFLFIDVFTQPFLEYYFGPIDLSSFDDIRGSVTGYVVLMCIMWVFAAFGEELLFHGFYMKWLAELMGDSNKAWLTSAVLVSLYFGISHGYQGTAGIIAVAMGGFLDALIFYKNRNNLALVVLVHGLYDSIGITLIYLNKERVFYDWIVGMIF